ncbi:Prephenate dehydratase [Liberibacter crescens BT-1]|uniref:prephenate dehydratase n=1 Tax=Liberibacter crescens (strain BT-1) TaxID=1215343 RepID=L0ESY9_LIBCB|nr:prephenate dehydratase [Liberibacter crescens]AGA64047.1 Prephenate dehydratase [Liberibacter crescens BT-1]AMC13274.1 prephenate dehydratase [Liberibacter crescens]
MKKIQNKIAFQGDFGANSDTACRNMFPDAQTIPCMTFDDVFTCLANEEVNLAMIPFENTLAGRVAEIHQLLPETSFHIIGEYFMPIHLQLMAIKGVTKDEICTVHSHIHALSQCRKFLKKNGWLPVAVYDTAGAAKKVAIQRNRTMAALAPRLAASLYELNILSENVEDSKSNITRFIIISRDKKWAEPNPSEKIITSLLFNLRNIPSALYKALGAFATNSVNMTKLEGYQVDGKFSTTQFYADIEGHPTYEGVTSALEELLFFSERVLILGVYKGDSMRNLL